MNPNKIQPRSPYTVPKNYSDVRDELNFNVRLVETVEKYNILYDHSSEDYSNRQIQERTWHEVGKELNETGANCKEKWRHIRSAFARYLRQKAQLEPLSKLKKKYYLAEQLDFLVPYIKVRSFDLGNLSTKQNDSEDLKYKVEDYFEENIDSSNNNFEEQGQEKEDLEILDNDIEDNRSTVENKLERNLKSKDIINRKRKDIDPLEKCNVEYFPSKKHMPQECEDPDLQFLKSLLPDIHLMNAYQKHEFKLKMIQTIGDILYQMNK